MRPVPLEISSTGHEDSGSISVEEALATVDKQGVHARRVLMAANAACYCGGMGGIVSPFIMEPLATEGAYSELAVSALASSVFAGMWVGSFVTGVFADAVGPGRVMMLCLVLVSLAGVAPALLPALAIGSRFLVGLGLCGIYQTASTYVAESVVTHRRSIYLSMLHAAIALGGLTSTLLAVGLQTAGQGWRTLLALNSSPALAVLLLSARFVLRHESPRWLLISGTPGACDQLLRRLAREGSGLAMQGGQGGHHGSEHGSEQLPPLSLQCDEPQCDEPSASGEIAGEIAGEMGGAGGRMSGFDETENHAEAEPAPASRSAKPRLLSVRRASCGRSAELVSYWRLHTLGCMLSFCLNFGSKGSEIWLGTSDVERH